jgi:predicted peptidase
MGGRGTADRRREVNGQHGRSEATPPWPILTPDPALQHPETAPRPCNSLAPEARIYLTGISCGAIGVWDYFAATTDNMVAAAVPISGHPAWAMERAGCAIAARAPIWVFHGARDDTVPVDFVEARIDDLRACTDPTPNELELTIYPDADHDAWTRTYDLSAGHDVYAWLLDHERN